MPPQNIPIRGIKSPIQPVRPVDPMAGIRAGQKQIASVLADLEKIKTDYQAKIGETEAIPEQIRQEALTELTQVKEQITTQIDVFTSLQKTYDILFERYRTEFSTLQNSLMNAVSDAKQSLSDVRVVQKGDKGDKGEPGESIQGIQGVPGIPGESIVGPMGPRGKDGKDGKNGKDAKPVDISAVMKQVLAEVNSKQDQVSTKSIAGLENMLASMRAEVSRAQKTANEANTKATQVAETAMGAMNLAQLGGGGSGGGFNILTATGTIDDSNTTFTFTRPPIAVVVNGAIYVNGIGVTISGTTVTTDFAVGTGGTIYGLGS